MDKFNTEAGRLRYHVYQVLSYDDGTIYRFSLGYKNSKKAAKELADRVASRHTKVSTADGQVVYEHLPE